jgi:invasion protein IalB
MGQFEWAAAWAAVLSTGVVFGSSVPAAAASPPAWRVECSGDGKALECRALQQVVKGDDKQASAQLSVRMPPDGKTPTMLIQLPLGLSLVEPVQLKVDSGAVEKQPVQTCTTAGCFVGLQLNDKLLASMRSGTTLRLAFQDANKRTVTVDVPLLGFGLALDKVK